MATDAIADAWMEVCFITVSLEGAGVDVEFAALTETVDISPGNKDIEGVPLVNGGRIAKYNPEGDAEITFEAYPLQAGTDGGVVGLGFFDLMHAQDTSSPIRVLNENVATAIRKKYRILVMWTNDPAVSSAKNISAANASAIRYGMAEVYFTSAVASFTDGILKWTVTAKCAAFDKAAASNVMWESAAGSDGTDLVPAVAAYTSSAKFS